MLEGYPMESDELNDVTAVIQWADSYPVDFLVLGEITLNDAKGKRVGTVKKFDGYYKFVPVIENGVEYTG